MIPSLDPARVSGRARKSARNGDFVYEASESPIAGERKHWCGYLNAFMTLLIPAVFNLTIADMGRKYPAKYREPIEAELRTIHEKKVAYPIKKPLRGLKHSKILHVKGFGREVLDPITGEMVKLKFRLVPGGHMTNSDAYTASDRSSPTVSMESVFMACNAAAYEQYQGFTMDIPGAYLNAELKDPHMVRLPRDITAILCEMYPETYAEYVQPDGTLLLLVTKAWYGLPESSKLWYDHISQFLFDRGFTNSPLEPAMFIKGEGDSRVVLLLWVDDFLGFAASRKDIDELRDAIEARFGGSRFKDGRELPFLGMTISQPTRRGEIFIKMTEYTKRIVEKSGVTGTSDTPYHRYLHSPKPHGKAYAVDKSEFLSLLMSAMYLGKRTRPEILIALRLLGSRVENPDNFDLMCLHKVYKYLACTLDYGLRFKPNTMTLQYWVDAAYGTHADVNLLWFSQVLGFFWGMH